MAGWTSASWSGCEGAGRPSVRFPSTLLLHTTTPANLMLAIIVGTVKLTLRDVAGLAAQLERIVVGRANGVRRGGERGASYSDGTFQFNLKRRLPLIRLAQDLVLPSSRHQASLRREQLR